MHLFTARAWTCNCAYSCTYLFERKYTQQLTSRICTDYRVFVADN